MRRLNLILISSVLLVTGCALNLGDGEDSDATTTSTGGTDATSTSDVDPVDTSTNRSVIGERCGIDVASGCTPESADWSDCTRRQCDGGVCLFGMDYMGYCTTACFTVGDCTPSTNSSVGQAFYCLKDPSDERQGLCQAGSRTLCSTDFGCANNNICKLGVREFSDPLVLGGICQAPLEGGAAPGELCNVDPAAGPVVPCASGMCVLGLCGQACSSSCDSNNLECVTDLQVAESSWMSVCLPRGCQAQGDCPDDFECRGVEIQTRSAALTDYRCLPVTP